MTANELKQEVDKLDRRTALRLIAKIYNYGEDMECLEPRDRLEEHFHGILGFNQMTTSSLHDELYDRFGGNDVGDKDELDREGESDFTTNLAELLAGNSEDWAYLIAPEAPELPFEVGFKNLLDRHHLTVDQAFLRVVATKEEIAWPK